MIGVIFLHFVDVRLQKLDSTLYVLSPNTPSFQGNYTGESVANAIVSKEKRRFTPIAIRELIINNPLQRPMELRAM